MKHWYVFFALCMMVGSTLRTSPALAQSGVLEMLSSSSSDLDQGFGGTVDLDGSLAVIGAVRDDDGLQLERGAVYVFRYEGDTWNEEAVLISSTPGAYNWFGTDVGVSGDVIVVSETNGDVLASNAGNVNIYRYNAGAWEEEAILTPPGGSAGESFGSAVDVDGQIAVVGAPGTDVTFADQGVAHVYRNSESEWTLEATLSASDPGIANLFGASISIDGNRVMIGAFNAADSTSNQAGKTYIFEFDGASWHETAVLQSNRSNNIANMGVSVGLDGDWAVSGVHLDNEVQGGAGAAIVHHYDGADWNFHSKLTASDGAGFYLFGTGVAVEDTVIIVGAENWAPTGESSTGKVYLFVYDEVQDEWIESLGLVPENTGAGDKFGSAVAIDGGVILAGAPDFEDAGAAFVYGAPKETTAIENEAPSVGFSLSAPYPNPFNVRTSLTITPDSDQPLRVALYDILGREVRMLFEGRLPANAPHRVDIPAGNAPGGLYFVRVVSEHGTVVKSVVIH